MPSFRRMNPVVKELWLAALRSGEFEQGRGYLNRHDRLCCLGVLCEVAIGSGEEVKKFKDGTSGTVCYSGCDTYPPVRVYEWAGLTPDETADVTLSSKNDGGSSFEEIANWIEENL